MSAKKIIDWMYVVWLVWLGVGVLANDYTFTIVGGILSAMIPLMVATNLDVY